MRALLLARRRLQLKALAGVLARIERGLPQQMPQRALAARTFLPSSQFAAAIDGTYSENFLASNTAARFVSSIRITFDDRGDCSKNCLTFVFDSPTFC